MVIKRTVILPSGKNGAFSRVVMPDGSNALVLDKNVHRKALLAAGKRLNITVREIKKEADERNHVRATR